MQHDPGSVNQEHYLVEMAQRLSGAPSDRTAVQLHLSKLRPENRRPSHLRIATALVMPLAERRQGQVFPLINGDIMMILRAPEEAEIDDLVDRMRYLFAEDPLTEGDPTDEPGRVATWYDLGQDYVLFRTVAERLYKIARKRRSHAAEQAPGAAPATIGGLRPLSVSELPQLFNAMEKAEVGAAVRREPVCVVMPDGPPRPIFWEAKVDLDTVCQAMVPGARLEMGHWLRQALEEKMLDRLLTWLGRQKLNEGGEPLSVDATISGLLSDGFLAFDSHLGAAARKRIFFEISDTEALCNLGQLTFVIEMLHDRGYHVVLDRLNHLTLPLIDRDRFEFDLVKLSWGPDYETDIRKDRAQALTAAIEVVGRSHVILQDCDSARALDCGRTLGLSLFQGAYVDRLLKQSVGASESATARSA